MKQGFEAYHWNDEKDNPEGGVSIGKGFTISWQRGPLGREKDRILPNGAFAEDVIEAVADRIRYYQSGKFACHHNAIALSHLESAMAALKERTENREKRGVEGTHEV